MEFLPCSRNQVLKAEPVALVLPALSIGNVGQLAVDLIISSQQASKIGYLDDPFVLPCIGNDPYKSVDKGELAVSLEVYDVDDDDDVRIVQQRAPVIKGTMLRFARNLSIWASKDKTKEVIILSGVDSGKRRMQDVESSPIRYISTANPDGTDQRCEALGWKKFEGYLPSSEPWKLLYSQCLEETEGGLESSCVELSDDMYYPSLPFASLFLCCKARGLHAVCILLFCSEGDNIQDAFFLAEALKSFRSSGSSTAPKLESWVVPYSWRSVYGPPPDPAMFS